MQGTPGRSHVTSSKAVVCDDCEQVVVDTVGWDFVSFTMDLGALNPSYFECDFEAFNHRFAGLTLTLMTPQFDHFASIPCVLRLCRERDCHHDIGCKTLCVIRYRGGQRAELNRLVVDTASGAVSRRSLSPRCCEFPCVNPSANGQQHSYLYVPASRINDRKRWGPNQVPFATVVAYLNHYHCFMRLVAGIHAVLVAQFVYVCCFRGTSGPESLQYLRV